MKKPVAPDWLKEIIKTTSYDHLDPATKKEIEELFPNSFITQANTLKLSHKDGEEYSNNPVCLNYECRNTNLNYEGQNPDYDIDAAKGLMADAGFANGFDITLNCPNDRYINDEGICQAAVGMMARIGINVTLDAKPKAQHFPIAKGGEAPFYMLGWGVPTFDSHYIFNYLVHTQTDKRGSWNPTGYSNADVDAMIVSLESETDLAARDATIAKIWSAVQDAQMYLPIHNQVLNWGMKNNIDFDVQPEDTPHFQFLKFK